MKEIRCKNPECNGILLKAIVFIGQIICHRCKQVNDIKLIKQSIDRQYQVTP